MLIASLQSYQNSALREHKDQCYARREQRNPSLAALLGYLDETFLRTLTTICAITDDNQLNDAEKVEGIRTLLDTHETSVSDDGVNLAALKRDLASELSEDDYNRILEARSVRIQNRISPIIMAMTFQGEPGSRELRYVTWLHQQHYAPRNVHRRVPVLMQFAFYAQSCGAKVWTDLPNHVQPFVQRWLRERGSRCSNERARKKLANCIRGPIEQMLSLALPDYVGSGRGKRPHPFLEQAPGFFKFLQEERGLSPRTLECYDYYLRRLQTYLHDIKVSVLEELSPMILSAFVTARGQEWGKSAITVLCAALRMFLRYLHREGLIRRDLSSSVDSPKRYRLAEIPRSISWTDVGRMLEAVDRRTAVGRRDYAILLLLVTYGLRSREIAALTLEDLNWQRERLRVPERKAGHSTAYPLSPIVGEAILDYLKVGRPNTSDRHIFFRGLAPLRPLTEKAISSRAAYYLQRAGITVARSGSHTLRHTCVQRLVDAHFSLKTIGDYVGHRSPDSTMIYSKVDVETLRDIARGCGEEVV